ncbi:hypothetical protein [Kineococcus radiotolerans]|uniref:Uncharacterized protein n=1 Tax=Kineococcus radiotolerans (strain ATCC BAA-149 / DSM 14245 / SRS30216) TaxID=266940 RepID=A6WH57_KINRD|nr:hypothetical protein [Kineococcus radiotolerans]ABS06146.1 hypothetical protein Krad_4688 [Kineococcus radiotolerans SRS30216 = ATCC BAA-149]
MTLTLTIPAATEYVDRTLATASWWDKYTILPGTYEVEVVTINGHPVPADSPRAYYVRARIDAVLTETYRVNRVFTASSAEHRPDLAEHTTVTWSTYSYNLWDERYAPYGGTITTDEPATEAARLREVAARYVTLEAENESMRRGELPSARYAAQAARLEAVAAEQATPVDLTPCDVEGIIRTLADCADGAELSARQHELIELARRVRAASGVPA